MATGKQSHKLQQRFISDNNMPIQVYHAPHFEYFLDLFESYCQSRTKWDALNQMIDETYGNPNVFLDAYYTYRNNIIEDILSKESYMEFCNCILEKQFPHFEYQYSSASIYNEDNDNKCFVSIDLKKANFQALKHFDPNIVSYAETYDKFIDHYVGVTNGGDYLKASRYFRQVVFGKLNAKRQLSIQKWIIGELIKHFTIQSDIEPQLHNIVSVNNDEVIVQGMPKHQLQVDIIQEFIAKHLPQFEFSVQRFTLKKLQFEQPSGSILTCYKKVFDDKTFQFQCCPVVFFPQVYKLDNGHMSIQGMDKVFYYEGNLAVFNESLKLHIFP